MARTPSYSLLAKDAIGQALNISTVKTVEDRAKRINDYNMAIAEIYNILGFIDTNVYLEILPNITASMYGFPKCGTIDLSIDSMKSWDKIIELEILIRAGDDIEYSQVDGGEEVDYSTFSSHRGFKCGIDPYDESVIFTVVKDKIYFLVGESLGYKFNTVKFNIVYRRQPVILVSAQWDYEKVDLPDKYWALLVNRIASIIEFRAGIADKAMAMVKMSYEQLLSTIDPVVKASIMKSLETPVGVI